MSEKMKKEHENEVAKLLKDHESTLNDLNAKIYWHQSKMEELE